MLLIVLKQKVDFSFYFNNHYQANIFSTTQKTYHF